MKRAEPADREGKQASEIERRVSRHVVPAPHRYPQEARIHWIHAPDLGSYAADADKEHPR